MRTLMNSFIPVCPFYDKKQMKEYPEIIQIFNKENDRKIKIKWLSNKLIKEKSLSYKKLKSWKPIKSNISDIIKIIKN